MCNNIPIIIPAYEPDNRLLKLLNDISNCDLGPVIIVDDGSGSEFCDIFSKAYSYIKANKGVILTHPHNMGKGHALKTAFTYVLATYPSTTGVVTADSDGQHNTECIKSVIDTLARNRDSLVLGVRNFSGSEIPWKSRFGNKLMTQIFYFNTGIKISDTQTGLRGIPISLVRKLIDIKGERFEFETNMLLESVKDYHIIEVPIQTIYESKYNHQTHFDPIKDSIKIYRIIGAGFFKYILSSFSSSIIDILMFSLLCHSFRNSTSKMYIAYSTVLARILSAIYNYVINYKLVFSSNKKITNSAPRYFILAIIQMTLSAALTTFGSFIFKTASEVIIKICVDAVLFFINYYLQKKYVY